MLPRRQGRHHLHQALCRDLRCARPRVRRHPRHPRLAHHLLQRQPQRRGRNHQSHPEAQPAPAQNHLRGRLQQDRHQGTAGHRKHSDPQPGAQNQPEATGRLYPRRTKSMVRQRRAAPELRRTRRLPGRIPERRTHPGGAEQRRLLYHQLRRQQPLRRQHPHHREIQSRQGVDRRPLRCRPAELSLHQAFLFRALHPQAELPGREQEQPPHSADRRILSTPGSSIRRTRQLPRTIGSRSRRIHRREGLQGQGKASDDLHR